MTMTYKKDKDNKSMHTYTTLMDIMVLKRDKEIVLDKNVIPKTKVGAREIDYNKICLDD